MFGRESIRCPHCLHVGVNRVNYRCRNQKCNTTLDRGYVNSYSEHPAFFVPLLGKSGVGKTVYLQTLMITLRQISRLWKNSSAVAADSNTARYIRASQKLYDDLNVPSMTQIGEHEVFTMHLRNIAPWKDITLVLRDLSGEYYDELVFPVEVTNFLARQPILYMMLSLPEVLRSGYDIDELFNNYLHTQRASRSKKLAKPRDMVVILSQADDAIEKMPRDMQVYLYKDYFNRDSIWNEMQNDTSAIHSEVFIKEHCRTMEQASNYILNQLHHQLSPVTALANSSQINLHFCLLSSLGQSANSGNLSHRINPYRVLDPLLWGLKLTADNKPKR